MQAEGGSPHLPPRCVPFGCPQTPQSRASNYLEPLLMRILSRMVRVQ